MRKTGRKIIFLLFFLIIIYILGNAASIYFYGNKDESRKADVAVVLGAGLVPEGVSPVFRERINHGIDLYRAGLVKKIIITGGYSEGSPYSDSYVSKLYAVSNGVPAEDVLIEERSTVTEENLLYAKQIMDENGYKTAILVSDPLHMKRAMRIAENCGMTVYSSPTPTSMYQSTGKKIRFLAREVFYYIGYKFMNLF